MAAPQPTLVTAYVRLNAGHRPHDRFLDLGNRLLGLGLPTIAFLDGAEAFDVPESTKAYGAKLEDCYLYDAARYCKSPYPADAKDTTAYMVVQHEKSAWLHEALDLTVCDLAVWVGVSAGHRDAAFAASRYVIDEVKARVPIWKHERYAEGDAGWLHPEA